MTLPSRLPCLTVYAPYAWALVHGYKDIENRHDRFAHYQGYVGIHAGQQGGRKLREAADEVRGILTDPFDRRYRRLDVTVPSDREFAAMRGQLLGIVRLGARWTPANPPASPWYRPGAVGIEVRESLAFAEPIACVGALGLWSLDEPTTDRIYRVRPVRWLMGDSNAP